jgi:hypothetical protein
VVETGIALYIGCVAVAEVMAGEPAVSRERKGGGVIVGLEEYGPSTLWVA